MNLFEGMIIARLKIIDFGERLSSESLKLKPERTDNAFMSDVKAILVLNTSLMFVCL